MPSLEKVQLYGMSLSRNAIHTTTYHGAISISMYTHISRLNATPMFTHSSVHVYTLLFAHCFHLPWLTNPTIVRVEIWPLSAYPCAHAALDPCVSRSLRKSSVKTPLSTTSLTRWHQSPDPDPPSLPMGRSSTLPSASNTPLSPPPTPRAHPCIAIYPRSVRM